MDKEKGKKKKPGKKKRNLTPQEKKKARIRNAKIISFNLLGMIAVVFCIFFFGMMWLRGYVDHKVEVEVPDVAGMTLDDAKAELRSKGFSLEIQRYEYSEGKLQDEVIEQIPKARSVVKNGRKIYVVLNTTQKPKKSIPGVIDNCSLREAQARIVSAGFTIEAVDTISGEKDWVYEVLYDGHSLSNSDAIPEGAAVTIIIGNGVDEEELDEEPEVDEDFFE